MSDSRSETYKHITAVRRLLAHIINELLVKSDDHDMSKLESPEVEIFDEFTTKLAGITYGSDEYKECLKQMKPALDHHYCVNNHHPEFFVKGIQGMTLVDLIEMLADWQSASKRHVDGSIYKSIELNQKRFGYSDELKNIFLNTIDLFGEHDEN